MYTILGDERLLHDPTRQEAFRLNRRNVRTRQQRHRRVGATRPTTMQITAQITTQIRHQLQITGGIPKETPEGTLVAQAHEKNALLTTRVSNAAELGAVGTPFFSGCL